MKNNEVIINSIRSLVRGDLPESDISELLYEHRCYELLAKMKESNKFIEDLAEFEKENLMRVRESYEMCHNLFDFLEEENISYAVVKGAVLSKMIYGDCFLRRSGDIDILISRENIEKVKRFLGDDGFVQGRMTLDGVVPYSRQELLFQSLMSHQIAPFVKCCTSNVHKHAKIDINLDIMWGENERKTDMQYVLGFTEMVNICDTKIRKFTNEMEFIALCLHHYKDMNSIYLLSESRLRLKLFYEIYLYIKKCKLNLDILLKLGEKLSVTKYLYYCLYYVDTIFADAEVKRYKEFLYTAEAENIIDYMGLSENERIKWDIGFIDRLLMPDMEQYLRKVLPHEYLQKIEVNRRLM